MSRLNGKANLEPGDGGGVDPGGGTTRDEDLTMIIILSLLIIHIIRKIVMFDEDLGTKSDDIWVQLKFEFQFFFCQLLLLSPESVWRFCQLLSLT